MIKITMLVLSLVLVIGLFIPAYANTPLEQWQVGTPINQIQCSDNKTLMESTNRPYCVSQSSSIKLLDRGFMFVEVLDSTFETRSDDTTNTNSTKPKDTPYNHIDAKTLQSSQDILMNEKSESLCDVKYFEIEPGLSVQYQTIEPASHFITGGKFLEFCAEPNHRLYKIYLDTDKPGTLILEIPKDKVDLKQFDYKSCYSEIHTDVGYDDIISITQIAQTDISRTLKFTWSESIKYIEHFGSYNTDIDPLITMPNYCVDLVESGEISADIKDSPYLEEEFKVEEVKCYRHLDLNYTITNGNVYKICGMPYDPIRINFLFTNVTDNAEIIIDIPWTELQPYVPGFTGVKFWGDTNEKRDQCEPSKQVLFQNHEYRTMKISLLPGAKSVKIGDVDYSSVVSPLSEILKYVKPFNASKEDTRKCYD